MNSSFRAKSCVSREASEDADSSSSSVDTLLDVFARVVRNLKSEDSKKTYTSLLNTYRSITQNKDVVIGIYGRPKMGKSTLLNTILGAQILPVSAIPMTGSVIDVKRDNERSNYELFCKVDQSRTVYLELPTAEEVRDYLTRHGSQEDPFSHIEISGPFPDALPFMKSNYILRDTPGFERLLTSETAEGTINKRLAEDTDKTIASLDRPDIYLFCVSADTPGQAEDVKLYDDYFRNRFCVHIMTHCEDRPAETITRLKNKFYREFRLLPDYVDKKPLVCTGISGYAEREDDDLVLDFGVDDMVSEVENSLDPKKILERILAISRFIIEEPDKAGAGDVPRVHLSALKALLKQH